MIRKIQASAVFMVLMVGLLFVASGTDAMAQGKGYRSRSSQSRSYHDHNYSRNDRGRFYEEPEATNENLIKRAGIGAGIGVLGGALLGGKTGAIIGGAAGALGGYIYHRKKIDDQHDRILGRD
jgi:YmgG-like glycine-zipper protein